MPPNMDELIGPDFPLKQQLQNWTRYLTKLSPGRETEILEVEIYEINLMFAQAL